MKKVKISGDVLHLICMGIATAILGIAGIIWGIIPDWMILINGMITSGSLTHARFLHKLDEVRYRIDMIMEKHETDLEKKLKEAIQDPKKVKSIYNDLFPPVLIVSLLFLFSCGPDYSDQDYSIGKERYKPLFVSVYSEDLCNAGYFPKIILEIKDPSKDLRTESAKFMNCNSTSIGTASTYYSKLKLSMHKDEIIDGGWMDKNIMFSVTIIFDNIELYTDTVNYEGFEFTIPKHVP